MLPLMFGAVGALFFVLFLFRFYDDLFIRAWVGGISYSVLISDTIPFLESSMLSFALSFTTLHLNRNRLIFAGLGTAISAYSIVNTVRFAGLNAAVWEGWAQVLFIQILVPLSIGFLIITIIPFVEETSRIERTMSSLTSSLANLENILENLETLSKKIENADAMKTPLDELSAIKVQIQSIGDQVRSLKSGMGSYSPPPQHAAAGSPGVWTMEAAGYAGNPKQAGSAKTPVQYAEVRAPRPPAPTQDSSGAAALPDCAKDNPWANVLSARSDSKEMEKAPEAPQEPKVAEKAGGKAQDAPKNGTGKKGSATQ